jgi:hypothetical protein
MRLSRRVEFFAPRSHLKFKIASTTTTVVPAGKQDDDDARLDSKLYFHDDPVASV